MRMRLIASVLLLWSATALAAEKPRVGASLVLYEDPKFYAAFPSIVRRPDGELIVAFRRAPERKQFGEAPVIPIRTATWCWSDHATKAAPGHVSRN